MYETLSKGIGLQSQAPHDWAAICAIANPSVDGKESFASLFSIGHEPKYRKNKWAVQA